MELKIFLGKDDAGADVHWVPKKEKNPHFMVVGTSGSGKTETLRAMVHELNRNSIPSMIIDFHRDFEDVDGEILDFNNITINPLEYGAETPEVVMYKVSHILKKIFALGVQQEGILQDAIQKSYRDKGINLKDASPSNDVPAFDDVRAILEEKAESLKEEKRSVQTVETLLVRLRPLFNTGFFSNKKSVPFGRIFKKTTVLRLKNMPTEEVKYAVAEFFINKLKYELYARGKSDKLVLYCVVDEAHRLIDEKSPLNDLLRESRKYGAGVILSSQRPSDFSDTVLANLGGILSFQCRLESDAMFVAKQMGIDFEAIKTLTDIGTGYINFSSVQKARRIKITPAWERRPKKEEKKEKTEPKIFVEPRAARISHDEEKIYVSRERATLSWKIFHALKTVFPKPWMAAVFTVVIILLLPVIGYKIWIVLAAVIAALIVFFGDRK